MALTQYKRQEVKECIRIFEQLDKDKLLSHYMDNNTELHNLAWDLILCPTAIDMEARHVAKCTVSVFKGYQGHPLSIFKGACVFPMGICKTINDQSAVSFHVP